MKLKSFFYIALPVTASLVVGLSASDAVAMDVVAPEKDCYKTVERVEVEETTIYDQNGNRVGVERKESKVTRLEKVDCPK